MRPPARRQQRTRVSSARWMASQRNQLGSAGERGGAGRRRFCTPSSVARTDQECARISSLSLNCSAGVKESSARAWPMVSRPARRSSWMMVRQSEQPETVGDRAPILADPLGQLLLGPAELREQLLIGLGLLHRVQVLAEEVLDERQLQALGVRSLTHDGGDPLEPSLAGRPPPPLAGDQLPAIHRSGARRWAGSFPTCEGRASSSSAR